MMVSSNQRACFPCILYFDGMTLCIGSRPDFIGIGLGRRLIQFESGPVFAGLSRLARVGRGWPIKDLVTLESDQGIDGQSTELTPQPQADIATIKQDQRTPPPKFGHEFLELLQS